MVRRMRKKYGQIERSMKMGDLLTISQLVSQMPFSRATLYRYIDEGLEYTVVNGKKKMFDPEVGNDIINSRKDTDIK